jgi:peptide/nickel transport system substrate-binding protein
MNKSLLIAAGAATAFVLLQSGPARAATHNTLTTVPAVAFQQPSPVTSLLPDPFNNDTINDFQTYIQLYPPLLWIGNNLKIDWKRSIVKSIDVSKDRKVFTVTLKHWKWSDGKPVTAADTRYNYVLTKEDGQSNQNYGIGGVPNNIASFKVLGTYRFAVTLKHPVNPRWFEINGLSQFSPVPEHAWGKHNVKWFRDHETDTALVKVVDGPYKVASFNASRYLRFVANPAYSGEPKPSIKHFNFNFYTNNSAAFSALKTGAIGIGQIPFDLYGARHLVGHLKAFSTDGKKGAYGYGFWYIPLNFDNPKVAFLHNLKVREALQYAIDQQAIINVVYHGLASASFSPIPPVPDTYLSPKLKERDSHPQQMYAPAKAKALLNAAGWKPGPGGVREKNGHKLAFQLIVMSGESSAVEEAQLLKQFWQAIGVDAHIRRMTFNQEIDVILGPKSKWETAIIPWYYAPDYYPTGGGLLNTGGGTNYGGYSNKRMDALIRASTTESGVKALYAYENYASSQLPWLWLPTPAYLVKYDPALKGMSQYFSPVCELSPQVLSYAK